MADHHQDTTATSTTHYLRTWELTSNSTRYEHGFAIPPDDEVRVEYFLCTVCTSIFAIVVGSALFAMLSSKEVRKKPFNMYVIALLLPDFIYAISSVMQFSVKVHKQVGSTILTEDGGYVENANQSLPCHLSTMWIVSAISANCYLNAVVAYEILVLLQSSQRRMHYRLPKARVVIRNAISCYILGIFLGCLGGLIPLPHLWRSDYKNGMFCFPMYYDIISEISFWLLFIPLITGIPMMYVIYVVYTIYKQQLLPPRGKRRQLALYFARIAVVYVVFWLPSIILITYPKYNPWLIYISTHYGPLQGPLSAIFFASKPDVKKALYNLLHPPNHPIVRVLLYPLYCLWFRPCCTKKNIAGDDEEQPTTRTQRRRRKKTTESVKNNNSNRYHPKSSHHAVGATTTYATRSNAVMTNSTITQKESISYRGSNNEENEEEETYHTNGVILNDSFTERYEEDILRHNDDTVNTFNRHNVSSSHPSETARDMTSFSEIYFHSGNTEDHELQDKLQLHQRHHRRKGVFVSSDEDDDDDISSSSSSSSSLPVPPSSKEVEDSFGKEEGNGDNVAAAGSNYNNHKHNHRGKLVGDDDAADKNYNNHNSNSNSKNDDDGGGTGGDSFSRGVFQPIRKTFSLTPNLNLTRKRLTAATTNNNHRPRRSISWTPPRPQGMPPPQTATAGRTMTMMTRKQLTHQSSRLPRPPSENEEEDGGGGGLEDSFVSYQEERERVEHRHGIPNVVVGDTNRSNNHHNEGGSSDSFSTRRIFQPIRKTLSFTPKLRTTTTITTRKRHDNDNNKNGTRNNIDDTFQQGDHTDLPGMRRSISWTPAPSRRMMTRKYRSNPTLPLPPSREDENGRGGVPFGDDYDDDDDSFVSYEEEEEEDVANNNNNHGILPGGMGGMGIGEMLLVPIRKTMSLSPKINMTRKHHGKNTTSTGMEQNDTNDLEQHKEEGDNQDEEERRPHLPSPPSDKDDSFLGESLDDLQEEEEDYATNHNNKKILPHGVGIGERLFVPIRKAMSLSPKMTVSRKQLQPRTKKTQGSVAIPKEEEEEEQPRRPPPPPPPLPDSDDSFLEESCDELHK